ncbi:hypothetical protein ACFOLC_15185 [Lysobacter cavernae]|uniref:Secreted protein n=1 Tax=Lysobacter cavernae TaxID=1685901 RepID=A0ABV7RT64_9GAMM
MRSILPSLLIAAALLFASPQSLAQQQAIERQMTPEQFQAAGLDRLSPQQLANLNAWLNGKLDVETTKAAQAAKKKVEEENRGFATFGSDEPIQARIVGEFRGFGEGRSYTLDNGQIWRQRDQAKLHGPRLTDPQVTITPSIIGSIWYMKVQGFNTRTEVTRIK